MTCAVYTAGGDGTVRGYDARSGSLRCEFIGHAYCINAIKVYDVLRQETQVEKIRK